MGQYLCIDIGGTAIKYSVYDRIDSVTDIKPPDITPGIKSGMPVFNTPGRIIEKIPFEKKYKCLASDKIDTPLYLQEFLVCMEAVYDNVKYYYSELSGISVSVPGKVTACGTKLSGGCIGYLKDFNLKKWLHELSGLPVSIENDGVCAVMAEHEFGALEGCMDGITVVFGTGIAGGIVADNKIIRGHNSLAAEFSYIIMGAGFYNGETLWSSDNGDYMLRSLVSEIKNIPIENLDGRKIFEMANVGDEEVNIVIDNYTKLIARNLFNLQAILDVERIAVGGGISNENLFIDGIINNFNKYKEMVDSPIIAPDIVKCRFGSEANKIGALVNFEMDESTVFLGGDSYGMV